MQKPKICYDESEITDDMLGNPIDHKMVVLCPDGRSLWPEIGDSIIRDQERKLRVKPKDGFLRMCTALCVPPSGTGNAV